ncbi:TonB-dependent receptor [Vulcaniibacterium tengchongense]|uniref:Outer membrane receptor protein involved in Fe transport n=1 Tax=Vulcaniibacterium tengchongense TaxID=1273429 RepID=A0A3N4VDE3_9GAMM|nr:TonB-dependent receptor [Vulcaniibacterium tengchongense]RPE79813.1 outer membrane receptor protein involved in Fe transport [Vulcaniibacterium tengchongense]
MRIPLPFLALALAAGSAHGQAGLAASADAVTLDNITVTAERTERSLKDTATSAVVLDRTALEQRGLDDSNDVLGNIANVTGTGTSNLAPAVRGVDGTGPAQGADAFFAGSRPRLNVQIDGRPASYNEVVFGNLSMWDVEQVEMLRGPQSTLQGRNAVAGTLAIRTREPTWESEAGIRLLAGSQRRAQTAFYLSGPLSDQVAYRIAGDFQTWRSFVDFEPYPGVKDPEDFAVRTLRGKLLFEPEALDGFRTVVTLQHADAHGPQVVTERRPFGGHVSDFPRMPVFAPRARTGIVDTQWRFAPRLAFENLLSVNDLYVERRAEAGTGFARIDGEEYVLEPRLRLARGDGRLAGVAGVYLYRADQNEFIDFPADEHLDDRVDTAALFGEGTVALREDLDLTLGARFERERHRRRGGDGTFVAIDIDETYETFLPKLGLAWRPDEAWTLGVTAARGYNGGGGGITYDFPIVSYSFDPEYVNNYEAYFRGDLLGGRMQLTGNVFYGEYRDMQLPFDLNPDPSVWSVIVRNADRARNYGAELGLRWLAAPGLTVHGDLGLLRTEVTDYPDSNIEGHEFANAPAATANLGFAWVAGNGFELSANARYSDAYHSSIDNHPRGKTEPYWLLDAKAGYRIGIAHLFAFVDNLLDDDTPLLITPGATAADDVATLPRPRSYGVGVELNF